MTLGIVMVSHVSDVVVGIKRLINEVAKDVSVTIAGGTEDNGVGTSFDKILTAFDENEADKILASHSIPCYNNQHEFPLLNVIIQHRVSHELYQQVLFYG